MERQIEAPNHTQIPNIILDNLAAFTDGELRLVLAVARKTFGWHKERDELSLSQLQALTGMHRPMVSKAIKSLMARNILERVPSGAQGFAYRLCVAEVTSIVNELVPLANQYAESTETSILSVPELVRSEYTQKKGKEKKEREERTVGELPPSTQTHPAEQANADSPSQESKTAGRRAPQLGPLATALAETCGINPTLAPKAQRARLKDAATALRAIDATPEQVQHFGRWFARADWRGRDRGELPTPELVRSEWDKAMRSYRPPTPPAEAQPEPTAEAESTRRPMNRERVVAKAMEYVQRGEPVPVFLRRFLPADYTCAA